MISFLFLKDRSSSCVERGLQQGCGDSSRQDRSPGPAVAALTSQGSDAPHPSCPGAKPAPAGS